MAKTYRKTRRTYKKKSYKKKRAPRQNSLIRYRTGGFYKTKFTKVFDMVSQSTGDATSVINLITGSTNAVGAYYSLDDMT